jgi:cysteine desulfurase/selenocysteine lyase
MKKSVAQSALLNLRQDFPILQKTMNGQRLAYLDTGASAQKPQIVIDAMAQAMTNQYANIHRGLYEFSQVMTQQFETVRSKAAKFINAKSENEIVFTRNATEGINLVAQSWGRTNLKPGDEIILTGMEHHANIVPWHILKEQNGLVIKFIPVREDGSLDLEGFEKLLSPRTRLVGVVHVSNALGTINDVRRITAMAKNHDKQIKVLVDASQSVVHSSVSAQDIGCDFLVFTGHKLYGPTGIGVLWGRYDILESMPPYQGGGDMIETVTLEGSTFKPPPARFEAGTPAIVEVIGLGAAIDYMAAIDPAAIEEREQDLLAYAMDGLDGMGLRFYGMAEDKAGIISFTADWGHPSDIATILDQGGVAVRAGHHCCQPLMRRFGIEATVRASLGLYSDENDIDQLVEGLAKARSLLS